MESFFGVTRNPKKYEGFFGRFSGERRDLGKWICRKIEVFLRRSLAFLQNLKQKCYILIRNSSDISEKLAFRLEFFVLNKA